MLGLNDKNCFTIGEYVLVGPQDARVVNDGTAIKLGDLGKFEVGETLEGSGGSVSIADSVMADEVRRCLTSADNPDRYVVISGIPR